MFSPLTNRRSALLAVPQDQRQVARWRGGPHASRAASSTRKVVGVASSVWAWKVTRTRIPA